MNTEWRELAACVDSDPEQWFPDGIVVSPTVLRICAACPVIDDCRTWALQVEAGAGRSIRFGIYGGLTPKQRWAIDRDSRQPAVPGTGCGDRVGTAAGYERHRRHDEAPCEPCLVANKQRSIERKLRSEMARTA